MEGAGGVAGLGPRLLRSPSRRLLFWWRPRGCLRFASHPTIASHVDRALGRLASQRYQTPERVQVETDAPGVLSEADGARRASTAVGSR